MAGEGNVESWLDYLEPNFALSTLQFQEFILKSLQIHKIKLNQVEEIQKAGDDHVETHVVVDCK